MNALIGVRSNAAGLLNPTPQKRQQAAEEVSANFRANVIGRLRAAGLLEQVMPAEADPVTAAKMAAAQPKQEGNVSRAIESELNRDAFLMLLMEQIRNQDPLDPMDNSAMVAQLAQFSALEQMSNLNTSVSTLSATLQQSLSFMSGASLIGRTVTWFNSEGDAQRGEVNAVTLNDGAVQLRVDGQVVPLNTVSVVE
jgi:flagellar basal-body rod modification protein FlgD